MQSNRTLRQLGRSRHNDMPITQGVKTYFCPASIPSDFGSSQWRQREREREREPLHAICFTPPGSGPGQPCRSLGGFSVLLGASSEGWSALPSFLFRPPVERLLPQRDAAPQPHTRFAVVAGHFLTVTVSDLQSGRLSRKLRGRQSPAFSALSRSRRPLIPCQGVAVTVVP